MSDVQVSGSGTEAPRGNRHDADYDGYLARLTTRFLENCESGKRPLFPTDATGLWDAYLDSFSDPVERQYYTCHACRQFVERFGDLVTIDEAGRTTSALWHEDDAPHAYRPAVAAMAKLVRRAKVTGVFLSSDKVWGTPVTGPWCHLAVKPDASMVFRRATQTAGQAAAEKREDFGAVMRALAEFTLPHVELALTLLQTEALYRNEKVIGQAEWLRDLHVAKDAAHGSARSNVVWRAIGTAPAGFCHPRSSMIGTLLEDIAAGMSFPEVSRRFADKMHPLQYQRPQAPPTAGAIVAAEKVIAQLGAAGSLARRFCRVEEVTAIWRPPVIVGQERQAGGVFGHLKAKGAAPEPHLTIPAQTMTWEKFQRTVLPAAERIEFYAPNERGSFGVLVTAVNPDAPPILQWDLENARNPVSWYFWQGGSLPGEFRLTANAFHPVAAVTLKPPAWGAGAFSHQGDGALFILDGAQETKMAGAALFPEILKAEFHGIRSVLEAYSRAAKIEGMNEPHAAGIMLQRGDRTWSARLRVTSGGRTLEYKLDRWD